MDRLQLSSIISVLSSLTSHPLWFVASILLYLVVRLQSKSCWRPRDCPVDLNGKTAIVTGSNTGVGRYIAQDFARRNARVILACRSEERGRRAEREIRQRTGNSNVHLRILDTSCMKSVREFADRIQREERRLDILVNNAGASGLPTAITPEGLELTFATNYLGHFLLTNLLLGLLKRSPSSRIVNVSSMQHRRGEVKLGQLRGEDLERTCFDQLYSNSKLMNVLFTLELSKQLRHTGVTVNAVRPGVVMTEIMRYYGLHLRIIFNLIGFFFFKSAEEGAVSSIYCALSKEMEEVSGKYIDSDCSLSLPSPTAQDAALARKLWEASATLTGLSEDGTGETH
ncbi:retinol dehydrogenase 11-like isoform X1 [Mobula birostris]|uniref:retinol dehydrogenase 11-like isoform X1 n=1 Tax=Mobula birostris TaxID=1983395 RepID=UPI003B284A6F